MISTAPETAGAFRHQALFYAGDDEFVDATAAFVRDGVEAGEPVLVVVAAPKIDWLRDALGAAARADTVQFADMAEVGDNPARIIPAWQDFVAERVRAGRRGRGVGEPIWAGRGLAEMIECQRHESLLNLAFADAPAWWLLCPYDTQALTATVIDEARRSHPFVAEDGAGGRSAEFVGVENALSRFDDRLPEPSTTDEVSFDARSLEVLRRFIAAEGAVAGLTPERIEDLVVAVNEIVSNSLKYGGGGGVLRVWHDADALVCEVRDGGHIADPLAGRIRPPMTVEGGRGLWLANQLCDLVQVRSGDGTVVRLHVHR